MFDRTITLFNFKKDTGKWYGTVINKTTLAATQASNNSARGETNGNNVSISIRVTKDKGILWGGKKYCTPKEYQVNDNVDGLYTFTPEVDFMVLDEALDQLEYNDDDYESGLYHYLNRTNDNVFMITGATYYSLIPHFVVTGR